MVIKTQKMSENGEFYTAGINFTVSPALTAVTNLTSDPYAQLCAPGLGGRLLTSQRIVSTDKQWTPMRLMTINEIVKMIYIHLRVCVTLF